MIKSLIICLGVTVAALATPADALAQQDLASPGRPVTVSFEDVPIERVLMAFADLSGRSMVVGADVESTVTARIVNQPWDRALKAILDTHGLELSVTETGILLVQQLGRSAARDAAQPLTTRVFRLRWQPAPELLDVVASMLSERGRVAVAPSTNALVVTDEPRAIERIRGALGS